MRKNYFFFKSLLLATVLMLGSANAWGYTPTLKNDLKVSGYKSKAYFDISTTNVNDMCPVSGDLRFRGSGFGLYNYGSGNRSADVVLPFSKDDIIILDFQDSQGRNVTVNSVENCTKDATLSSSTGFLVYKATANSDAATTIGVGRAGCIIAILVMEVDESAETADYTINYKDGETTVKTVSGSDVAIGTTIYIESSFFKDDVKYITDGGQISSFDVADGTNEYNIEVSEAEKYSYTVNATDGTKVLKVLASGSAYSGETVAVPFPRYFNIFNGIGLGTLYQKDAVNKEYRASVTISENEQVTNLVYTETDIQNIVYFSEGEEVKFAEAAAGGNMPIRSSNAKCGYAPSDITLTNLPAGTYRINVVFYSGSSAGFTVPFMLGGEAWDAEQSGASNWAEKSTEFTLTSDADITWKESGNNTNGIDFVYIQKLAVPVEITSETGFATLYTPNALDFSKVEGLTAYTATELAAVVTLTEVDNVKSNTGIVLKGVPGTYNVPVIASSETPIGHLLGSLSDPTPWDAYSSLGFDIYGLAVSGDNVQFAKVTSGSIPAGKAYFAVKLAAGAKALRVVYEGEATEVTAPEVAETEEEEEILFNMAGVQVDKSFKGFVINQKGEKRFNK